MLEYILSLFFLPEPKLTKYQQVVTTLEKIQRMNPSTTEMLVIGSNHEGEPIKGLRVGNGKINTLVVATHHGNEYGSTAVALAFAEELARNPIPHQSVYVIPVLNISGYNRNSRFESTNGMSIDPNRDYPGPCATAGPFKSRATLALAQFIADKNIITSATLHTYWPAVLYPWGISTRDTATLDETTFIELSKKATEESQYKFGNSTELLYAADGTFEDYAYWKHGIWSLLFELGYSHTPSATAVQEMIEKNVPGIKRFLAESPIKRASDHKFKGQCDLNVLGRIHLE